METLETVEIELQDKYGNKTQGHMAKCPDCGLEAFYLLIVDGHNHIQCINCNSSFCQAGENCGKDLAPSYL